MDRKDSLLLFIGGTLLLILTLAMIYKETHPQWESYQKQFVKVASTYIGKEKAKKVDLGLRQIYIPKLRRVDRCTTCHLGYNIPGLEKADEPFTTHPDLPFMKYHPFKKFGCTLCHGGQGYATKLPDAHGNVSNWNVPLLSKRLGEKYGLAEPGHIMEINCNRCHNDDQSTQWMDYINSAKNLVKQYNCTSCHTINGKGGTIGPDLTDEGDNNPENYNYSNVKGEKTFFNWLYQHFKNPAKVSKGTVMPNFNLSDKDAQALTMLVLSFRHKNLPYSYIHIPASQPITVSAVVKKTTKTAYKAKSPRNEMMISGAHLIKKYGCSACHTTNGSPLVGPSYKDLYGRKEVVIINGKEKHIVVDAAFIRNKILNPGATDVKGFPPHVMPSFKGKLNSKEINEIIEYIESLK